MNDVLKLGKKVFTVGVVLTTILWSVGVAALVPGVANAATCPALAAGDIIKVGANPKLYVLGNDLKLLVSIDNQVVTVAGKKNYFSAFKSWRSDEGYGTIVTITADCYSTLGMSAKAYGWRAGTTLLKHPVTGDLIVSLPNRAWAKISMDAAKALYGYTSSMVLPTFSDSDFIYSMDGGQKADVTEAKAHDGMLVSNGGKNWLVDGSMLREVTAAGMLANGFKTKYVHMVPDSAVSGFTTGAQIDAMVPALTDKSQMGGVVVVTPPVVTTGNVTVSLSASTPGAGNVVKAIDNVVFTKVNLTAGASAAVISSLTVGRMGLGSTDNFTSVTLYDGSVKLGSTRTSWDSNNQITFNLPNGFPIAAGATKEVTIVANLATAGTYNALGIVAVNGSAITPVYGNQMSGVTVTVGGVTITNVGTSATKNIGTTDVTLANFKLTMDSVEKGSFQRITLKNKAATANAADGDISNVNLWWGTKKLAGPVSMVSDKVTFNISESDWVMIDKSKNEEFKVVGDVIAGSVDQLEFVLDTTTDLYVVGQTYKTSMTVTSGAYNGAAEGMIITIAGAQFNLAYSGTALDTQADKTDVGFGTLTLSAGGTDVKVTSFILTVTEANGDSDATNNKDIDNFEMVEANGGAYSGTMTGGGDTDADAETWTFDDEIYLSKGQTRTFTLRGDVPAGVGSGDTYKVTLTVNTTNVVAETVPEGDAVSNFSIGSIDGKLVTVKSPYITIRPIDQNAVNAVVNQQNVVMYKTTVEATAGPVTISRVKFDGVTTTASNTTTVDANLDKTNFSDFGLYVQKADGSYELLQNITNGNMTDGEADFNSFSYTIQPGSANKVTLVFKGTISATLDSTNTTVFAELSTVTAKDADNNTSNVLNASGANVNTGSLKTTGVITLGSTGLLYVSMRNADTGFDKDRVALAGNSYWVGKLRLRADYENIKVMDLKLTNANSTSNDSVDSVCLYKTQSTAADQLIACTTIDSAGVAFFDDVNHIVTQGTHDVFVYVTTRPMGNLANATADTADAVQFSISTSSATNLTARGEASGTDLAYGNDNGTAASGEIVFDLNLDGTFDAQADADGTASTKTFTVAGSRPSSVTMVSSYGGYTVDTVISGTGEYTAAIFSITNEANSNTDANGNTLDLTLAALNLDLTKSGASTTFSGATVQRINGAVAAQSFSLGASSTTDVSAVFDTWTLAAASSSLAADAKISAGQTAYYVVKATLNGLNAADTGSVKDWFKVSLSNLTTSAAATTNISWYDGYAVPTNLFQYLQLDTTSISGTKVSE